MYSHISPPQHTVRADMDRCTPTALGFVLAPFLMSSSQSSVRVGVGWVPTQHTLLPSALCMFERPNSTFAASRMHQISMREDAWYTAGLYYGTSSGMMGAIVDVATSTSCHVTMSLVC